MRVSGLSFRRRVLGFIVGGCRSLRVSAAPILGHARGCSFLVVSCVPLRSNGSIQARPLEQTIRDVAEQAVRSHVHTLTSHIVAV